MESVSRRTMLGGAAAAAGLAAAAVAGLPASASVPTGPWLWALNPSGFTVPSDTWVKVPWPLMVLNETPAYVDADKATLVFPNVATQGIWALVANVAWDNSTSPGGQPIAPVTHRKLARWVQQDAAPNQLQETAYAGASTDLTYHADLALRGDQAMLKDGSRGYQQQQVYIQTGVQVDRPDQRIWVEVYQNSGQPLQCRFDGVLAPGTATRAPVQAWQAPSLMVVKVCDF